jgi:hypothetical protein
MKMYILYGIIHFKEGAEVNIIGFLLPVIRKEFNLNFHEISFVAIFYFLL